MTTLFLQRRRQCGDGVTHDVKTWINDELYETYNQ